MLLIDGVKYEEWVPQTEDEFEQVVKEHTQDIFSEKSIYLDRKQKLKSLSGIGAIPDGFAIVLGDAPHWHIVELELSSHPPHEHIVPQLSKFTLGIKNPSTQNNLVKAIYEYIAGDGFLTLKLKRETKCVDIYKFLSDLISQPPILTIIVEKYTPALREALSIFRDYQTKVVEFQTFVRERVGLEVHAHLFEPVFQTSEGIVSTAVSPTLEIGYQKVRRRVTYSVTIKKLIDTGILKVDQVIYGSHEGRKYEGKVLKEGKILVVHTGQIFDSPSGAATDIKGYQEDGWRWWYTIHNGKEYKLAELREEHKATHP